jgi:hypothetical protein
LFTINRYMQRLLYQSHHQAKRGLFPSDFSNKTLYAFFSPIRVTCPAHLIILDLISEKQKSRTFLLLNFFPFCFVPFSPKI